MFLVIPAGVDSKNDSRRLGSLEPLVIPAGVEPAIFWMRTRRPRPLDDGTDVFIISYYLVMHNLDFYLLCLYHCAEITKKK